MTARTLRPLVVLASFAGLMWLFSSNHSFKQVYDSFADAILDALRAGATVAAALFAHQIGKDAKGSKHFDGFNELLGIIGIGFAAALILGQWQGLRGQIFGMLVIYAPACLALTSTTEE